MGDVVSIFADGRLHRQLLDQIERLELTSLNGRFALRFIVATDAIQAKWLLSHVWDLNKLTFQFIVNGGSRVLAGRSHHIYGSADELNLCMVVEFHNPETNKPEELGDWSAMEIVLIAGKEKRSFMARRKEGSEAKQTS